MADGPGGPEESGDAVFAVEGVEKSSERLSVAAPPEYTALRVTEPPALDGRLAAPCWQRAPRSPRFVDLVSGASTALATEAAILWDDEHLYVGCWVEQPEVTATLTERDSEIWRDDDVELFIAGPDAAGEGPAGRGAYYELEINALGTIYEVLFAWGRSRTPFGPDSPPELHADHPQALAFDGVGYAHPGGLRTGFWGWDLPGLRTAVHVDGTLNDPSKVDRGWSVEIAVPWSSLEVLARADAEAAPPAPPAPLAPRFAVPPNPGDAWRIEVSRFNVAKHGPDDSGGWSWSPHGVWDSHLPELFPRVRFGADEV
ncbi:polyhydroxyalkanoate depolymerase [Schumannella soli]|uniref:Polyhydroxyalkanoate depolymerase n=2 Tax=Schumannella soli TaxID=2590779 RepID=A0A506XNV3_9MICO|nr:polyhydroxyalkanoate depolymerase [Schumannella soli]